MPCPRLEPETVRCYAEPLVLESRAPRMNAGAPTDSCKLGGEPPASAGGASCFRHCARKKFHSIHWALAPAHVSVLAHRLLPLPHQPSNLHRRMNPGGTRLMASATEPAWFTAGDVDGFFGLFFSGFPDLLLIVGLAPVCGFPLSFVASRILPGAAISVLAGNLFYAWQARRLARREGRSNVTAIPFGINTPTIFAYVFLIMGPIYTRTHDANLAWHAGIFASLLSGIVQTVGASCTDWLRRNTPRAACSPRWPAWRLPIFAWASSSASFSRLPLLCCPCSSCLPSMARVSGCPIVCRRLSSPSPSARSWWRCCAGSTSTPFLCPRCRR